MQILCFEDERVSRLHPITHARPAYAITCASFQLLDWIRRLDGNLSVSVRGYLAEIQQSDQGLLPPNTEDFAGEDVLLVNARLVPRVALLELLRKLVSEPREGAVYCDETDQLLLAKLKNVNLTQAAPAGEADADVVREAASPFRKSRKSAARELRVPSGDAIVKSLLQLAGRLPPGSLGIDAESLPTFGWPHDVVAWHMKEMPAAMEWRLKQGGYQETSDGVFVGEGVKIGSYAAVDTGDGPILLDDNVKVGPFCFLAGPVYAGKGTRVIEHAALKDGVSLGHTVKIGGEVEASVIEPYTNKQHHGFLGHSYLGSWINLGAGTCNSDLKNTYGKINIEYDGVKVATGMQFLGCIMGDYSKTAINTSIFTGKVIGVCSMLYGFATANVPSFVNFARLFGQQSLLPAEVMVNTQKRMFSRRNVEQRPCDIQLINDMYQLTAGERELAEQYGL